MLKFDHFAADAGGDFVGGPLTPRGGRDGFPMADADAAAEEAGDFSVAGPGFEGAVDDDGEDGDFGFAAVEDEGDAGGELADGAVFGAGALGEDVDDVALLETFNGGADGGEVGVAAFDGEDIPEFEEVVEEAALEERVAGHVVDLAGRGDADEPGVEEGLMVGDHEHAAGFRDACLAGDVEAEEEHGGDA